MNAKEPPSMGISIKMSKPRYQEEIHSGWKASPIRGYPYPWLVMVSGDAPGMLSKSWMWERELLWPSLCDHLSRSSSLKVSRLLR